MTGVSPAELLFGWESTKSLLRPDVSTTVQDRQASYKQHHDKKSRERHFQLGQSVLVENNRPEPKWVVGTVLEMLGDILYRVQVGTQVWKRHVHQLLQTTITQANTEAHNETTDVISWPSTVSDSLANYQPGQEFRRYPTRVRYPSYRYSPSNY